MGWFATRSVYLFATKENGTNIFEERIVCFQACDFEEANAKAVKEAEHYAADNHFEVHKEQLTYQQDGRALIDGYELWSELYEANMSLDEFYNEQYRKNLYHPDVD